MWPTGRLLCGRLFYMLCHVMHFIDHLTVYLFCLTCPFSFSVFSVFSVFRLFLLSVLHLRAPNYRHCIDLIQPHHSCAVLSSISFFIILIYPFLTSLLLFMLSYLILSYLILSYLILSYLILSCSTVLMCHARSCVGQHSSPTHANICKVRTNART
jgi:hypothetical protein